MEHSKRSNISEIKTKKLKYTFTFLIVIFTSCQTNTKPESTSAIETFDTNSNHQIKQVDSILTQSQIQKEAVKSDTILITRLMKTNSHVGYWYEADESRNLSFKSATKAEFDKASAYNNREMLDLPTQDTVFYLTTRDTVFAFEQYRAHKAGHWGTEYLAYYPDLKLHAVDVRNTSEGLGFGALVMIDSLTGRSVAVASQGDGAASLPVPSTDLKHMVYYYNYMYDKDQSVLTVVSINENKREEWNGFMQDVSIYQSRDWRVKEIRWIDPQNLILQVYYGYEHRIDSTWYLKATLPK